MNWKIGKTKNGNKKYYKAIDGEWVNVVLTNQCDDIDCDQGNCFFVAFKGMNFRFHGVNEDNELKRLQDVEKQFKPKEKSPKEIEQELKGRKCKLCGRALVKIGRNRNNGDGGYEDWKNREYHVKCWAGK